MTESVPSHPMDSPESLRSRHDPREGGKRQIKIGSQRDQPISAPTELPSSDTADSNAVTRQEPGGIDESPGQRDDPRITTASPEPELELPSSDERTPVATEPPDRLSAGAMYPPTRIQHISDDLRNEIEDALRDVSMDDLLAGAAAHAKRGPEPEIDQRYRAIVVKVHRDNVFLALPGGFDGVLPLKQLAQRPQPGETLDVVVGSWNREEGLYQLRTTGGAVSVTDWTDLDEGIVVDARVTGHNAGGLECEVQQIPAFIPIGQVSLYRVEDLSEYVGQRIACVVLEANPRRGNLVLSRRAVLEREREASRKQLLESMEPGQVREGVIRSVRDFGAFVDLGGIDGLIHVSKLSWDRISHPSEVVEEGQRVKVRVEKVDPATGKISLSYRDMVTDPWEKIEQRFFEGAIVQGTVTKVMEFGAFVRLEAGIEGLIHISELAHHRVTRADSVVQTGQEVTVKVLSIDEEAQRISLSRKAAITEAQQQAREALAETEETEGDSSADAPRAAATDDQTPLRGGMDRRTGGEKFGLKW